MCRVHSPSYITTAITTNPVIAIDLPRPDFRIACIDLLIGLVATLAAGHDYDEA